MQYVVSGDLAAFVEAYSADYHRSKNFCEWRFPQKSASQVSVGFVVSEITTRIIFCERAFFLDKDDSIVNN